MPTPPTPPPTVTRLSLVAVSGDIEAGTEWVLDPEEALQIGRTSKGVQLPDMLVSMQHAKILFDKKRGWIVEDLGSATGTWVDEECIKATTRPLTLGTRLRFGDTSFVIASAKRATRNLTFAIAATLVFAVGLLIFRLIPWGDTAEAVVKFNDEVLINREEVTSRPLDLRWFRERGIPWWKAKHIETTNHDHDASDEVWLDLGEDRGVGVFTFDPQGRWVVLGIVPAGCRKVELGMNEFPELICAGEAWLMTDGRYQIHSQQGVVVWYQERTGSVEVEPEPEPAPAAGGLRGPRRGVPPPAPEPDPNVAPGELPVLPGREDVADLFPPLHVARMAVRNESSLAAFLADRGIYMPVHYLVCEGAFDGIRAQALREDGTLQPLSVGCLADLRMTGTELGRPVAFAVTPEGRQALIDDVTTFYAGSAHGLFLPEERRDVIERLRATPGPLLGGPQLHGETRNPVESRTPILPDERYEITGTRVMENLSYALVAAPPAETIIVASHGVAKLDPPGCVELRLDVRPFGPRARGTFLEVQELGCPGGPRTVLEAPYAAGLAGPIRIPDSTIDIVAEVEGEDWPTGFEVSRLRFSWRETSLVNRAQ
jgi:hypothetical protein